MLVNFSQIIIYTCKYVVYEKLLDFSYTPNIYICTKQNLIMKLDRCQFAKLDKFSSFS